MVGEEGWWVPGVQDSKTPPSNQQQIIGDTNVTDSKWNTMYIPPLGGLRISKETAASSLFCNPLLVELTCWCDEKMVQELFDSICSYVYYIYIYVYIICANIFLGRERDVPWKRYGQVKNRPVGIRAVLANCWGVYMYVYGFSQACFKLSR